MAIRQYTASADTTITNAFKSNNIDRATLANMGQADVVEVFYNNSPQGPEKSRALFKFDISGVLSGSGIPSASYYLKLFNAQHNETLPEKGTLEIKPVDKEWSEGYGLDLDEYTDTGLKSGSNADFGANWEYARSSSAGVVEWTSSGGDFINNPSYTYYLEDGDEDLEVDITELVEDWRDNNLDNHGVVVKFIPDQETGSLSFYTKKMFARGTEFFHQKPVIEERWDSSIKDDKRNFTLSASYYPQSQNRNNIVFYNQTPDGLQSLNLGGSNLILRMYEDKDYQNEISTSIGPTYPVTASENTYYSGVYEAQVELSSSNEKNLFGRWEIGGNKVEDFVVRIAPETTDINTSKYVVSFVNSSKEYTKRENPRVRVCTRKKNWNPTVYTKLQDRFETNNVENLYYKIERVPDNYTVVPYGQEHTRFSYDASGSYTDLNTDILESDMMYEMKLAHKQGKNFHEFDNTLKFRIVE